MFQCTITRRKTTFFISFYILLITFLYYIIRTKKHHWFEHYFTQNYRCIYFCFDQFIILCPLAVTFRILNTRSTDNQLYLIAHPNNAFHRIFTYVFPIIQWFITVAAGSVKCGSNNHHYRIRYKAFICEFHHWFKLISIEKENIILPVFDCDTMLSLTTKSEKIVPYFIFNSEWFRIYCK